VWNLVSHVKVGTEIEGVWEQAAGENIWNQEGERFRRLEKIAW
jgi:hypothetical protein